MLANCSLVPLPFLKPAWTSGSSRFMYCWSLAWRILSNTLTRQTFVGEVMSLLFNMLSRLVIAFLPRNKRLLISWLQSPFAVVLKENKAQENNVCHRLYCFPIYLSWSIQTSDFTFHEKMGTIKDRNSMGPTGEGNGNPLQCSCLENPRDCGAWWAAVYGVAQTRTRLKWLSSSSSNRSKRY